MVSTPNPASELPERARLSLDHLRWRCPNEWIQYQTTRDVPPLSSVMGQDDAVTAMRFGLEIHAPGQNVFVRGLSGTGRGSLVKNLLEEIEPTCPPTRDRCYVHNFEDPYRPRLITLGRGEARELKKELDRLIEFIDQDLANLLSSEEIQKRQQALETDQDREIEELTAPFQEELKKSQFTTVAMDSRMGTVPAILPILDGETISPEAFEGMVREGKISKEKAQEIRDKTKEYIDEFLAISGKIRTLQRKHRATSRKLFEDAARSFLEEAMRDLLVRFRGEDVQGFLRDLIEDVSTTNLQNLGKSNAFLELYRVNVLMSHREGDRCPVIVEHVPSTPALSGCIDYERDREGEIRTNHMMIRAGSLLRADGGYLVLEARDVLNEPGAWRVLVRTLKTGRLEIVPHELTYSWAGMAIKPEPIEVNVKVILIGDAQIYALLDHFDHDFSLLFKVLVDFDSVIPRDETGASIYAGVLSRLAREESLAEFDRGAIASIIEHGSRLADRKGRLSARFGRLADLAREAAHLCRLESRDLVSHEDVANAIARTKRRADLPARRYREHIAEGRIRIQVEGSEVGQINGLAVMHAGLLTYGFPARITSTIGPGTAGTINIEREAQLSGAIHTKGFYILGGLLRHLLRAPHPLTFEASVAFEQSYGGIDGDSASGAEICCLLSALTGVGLRQDLAMTGAIDQLGNILPIGAVNEKIEGFFDVCRDIGLTGTQGVIIPHAQRSDLMLRRDVVEACAEGRFSVFAVSSIREALELMSGYPAGVDEDVESNLIALARRRAKEFWELAVGQDAKLKRPGAGELEDASAD